MRKILLEFSSFIYCYTQLCNYREEFVFKPFSSQFNIVVGCNLSLTGP